MSHNKKEIEIPGESTEEERGKLSKILPLFKVGLGGRIGNGNEYMSWIGLDDLLGLILYTIVDESISGPINAVSPNPITNADFTTTLGKVLSRPTMFSIPKSIIKSVLGEELALFNQTYGREANPGGNDVVIGDGIHAYRTTKFSNTVYDPSYEPQSSITYLYTFANKNKGYLIDFTASPGVGVSNEDAEGMLSSLKLE